MVAGNKEEATAQAAKASEKTDDKRTYYVVDTPIYDSGTPVAGILAGSVVGALITYFVFKKRKIAQ